MRAVRGRCHAHTKRLTAAVPGRQSHRAYARRVCCSWPRRDPSFQARCSVWAARPERRGARAQKTALWRILILVFLQSDLLQVSSRVCKVESGKRCQKLDLVSLLLAEGGRCKVGRGVMATCSMEAQDVQARGAGPQSHRVSAHRPSSGKRAQWGVHIEEPQSTRPAEVSPS